MEDILSKLKSHADGKVAVFIDAANILYSQQSMGWQFDYKKLSKFLKRNFDITFIGFYLGILKKSKGQRMFLEILKDHGYTVRSKPVKYIHTDEGRILKGNLDVELAVDVLTKIDDFDTCFLFSGDSDFEIVVRIIRSKGKKCVVFSTKKHIAWELIKSSNKYFDLRKFARYLARG